MHWSHADPKILKMLTLPYGTAGEMQPSRSGPRLGFHAIPECYLKLPFQNPAVHLREMGS